MYTYNIPAGVQNPDIIGTQPLCRDKQQLRAILLVQQKLPQLVVGKIEFWRSKLESRSPAVSRPHSRRSRSGIHGLRTSLTQHQGFRRAYLYEPFSPLTGDVREYTNIYEHNIYTYMTRTSVVCTGWKSNDSYISSLY